jgi:hypothetical protein
MTATLDGVAKKKPVEQSAEQQAAVELVRLTKEQGLSLTGPGRAAETADQEPPGTLPGAMDRLAHLSVDGLTDR